MTTDLPTRFYDAFAARDAATMNACYADGASFTDPVFTLEGEQIATMWTALCKSGKDLEVTYVVDESAGERAVVRWEAKYTFRATKRHVVNNVTSTMWLQEGKIVRQVDEFSFPAWAAQAFGPVGRLLGWAPPFQAMVAKKARAGIGL